MISGGSITHAQPSELKYFELPFEKVNEEKIEITIPNLTEEIEMVKLVLNRGKKT